MLSPSSSLAISSRDLVGSDGKGRVEMNISLRDAARGVSEQSSDCEFGKSKISGNTREGVPEDMRGDTSKFCLSANPIEHPNDANKVPIADIGRENVRRMLLSGLALDTLDGRATDHPELFSALRVREADGTFLPIEPRPL